MNRRTKFIAMILFLCLVGNNAIAQAERDFFYGATASADFGRFQDHFEITPLAGIKILPKTYIGLGLTLAYHSNETVAFEKRNNTYAEFDIKDKTLYKGGEVFLRYVPLEQKELFLKNLYFQASYEALWGKGKYYADEKYKYNTDNFTPMVGIGYRQLIFNRFSLGAMLSFKLNNEADSPYKNPIVRMSFEF